MIATATGSRRGWTGRLRGIVAALALAALLPVTAAAQAPSLDRVESLVGEGRYEDARATLEAWWSARQAFEIPGSDLVRGLMLRARLQPDPARAEADYLAIVLGYPTSERAPEALLRLGQGLLASGQTARAAGYLQRLVADYPGRPERTRGLLWLARARNATRQPGAACAAAREGLADAGADPELAAMLSIEAGAACGVADAGAAAPRGSGSDGPDRGVADAPERRAPPTPTPTPATAGAGEYAVQTGAFRYREGADALAAKLRAAGFEPRAVLVPANSLLRIRVGRFPTAREAARLAERLKSAGFEAVVVRDADREQRP